MLSCIIEESGSYLFSIQTTNYSSFHNFFIRNKSNLAIGVATSVQPSSSSSMALLIYRNRKPCIKHSPLQPFRLLRRRKRRQSQHEEREEKILLSFLRLPFPPNTIECYDLNTEVVHVRKFLLRFKRRFTINSELARVKHLHAPLWIRHRSQQSVVGAGNKFLHQWQSPSAPIRRATKVVDELWGNV